MANGMLSNLQEANRRRLEEERKLRAAQSYPQMAGRGLAEALSGAFGLDPRTGGEQQQAALGRVQQQVGMLNLDPNDPKSLDLMQAEMARALAKEGFPGEAAQMAAQMQEQQLRRRQTEAAAAKAERVPAKDALTEKYWQTVEKLASQGEAQDPALVQTKAALEKALNIKAGDFFITPPTKTSPGYILNKTDGTFRELAPVRGDAAEAPAAPSSRPIKQEGMRDSQGNQVYTDKDGSNWITSDGKTWKEPEGPMAPGAAISAAQDKKNTATLPAAARTSLTAHDQLAEVTRQAWKALQEAPTALGAEGYVPEMFREWFSSNKARDARAKVANIGSTLIQQRSGAAVTDKEFQRLEPFIPSIRTPDVAAPQKVRAMYEAVVSGANAIRATNNLPEMSYPPLDAGKAKAPSAPATPAAPAAAPQAPAGWSIRKK